MTPPPSDPEVGHTVAGHRIERVLGRGGMGVACLARGPRGEVVIKLLSAEAAANPTLRKRFRREGRALQKVRAHPNVVRVYDSGDTEPPYLLMEYVEGGSLARRLAQRGRLAPVEAARIAQDVALGLAAIHSHGLVHRDIKPANVLLSRSGRAKIVDLGLAKDAFLSGLTAPGQLMGTVSYMSPEQWTQQPQGPACDLFALGALLYHMLSGRPPFVGEDLGEVADLAQAGNYPPLRELADDLPAQLELAVCQLLMPAPQQRYPSAEAVADDLEGLIRGHPASVPALIDPSDPSRRHPLIPGRRFSLGSARGCEVVIDHPSVAGKHARIARKAQGYVLSNQRGSTGTFVGEQAVEQAVTLADGDVVRLGEFMLLFSDPPNRVLPPPYLRDVRREPWPEPVARTLAESKDPRAVIYLLEQLAPDPIAQRATAETIAARLGLAVLQAVERLRQRDEEHVRAWASRCLSAISGESLHKEPLDWLLWWDMLRPSYPGQVVAARPVPAASLELLEGAATPTSLPLERGMTLIGRDAKCSMRLEDPAAERLHATVLRLHTRWLIRDEGGGSGVLVDRAPVGLDWLDPGAVLTLGRVRLELRVSVPPAALSREGHAVIDVRSFRALRELRHPTVCAGLAGVLGEAAQTEWPGQVSAELFPPNQAAAFAERLHACVAGDARQARQELVAILGEDVGDEPRAWRSLLAERADQLPPQLVPLGWLASTR